MPCRALPSRLGARVGCVLNSDHSQVTNGRLFGLDRVGGPVNRDRGAHEGRAMHTCAESFSRGGPIVYYRVLGCRSNERRSVNRLTLAVTSRCAREPSMVVLVQRASRRNELASNCHTDFDYCNNGQFSANGGNTDMGELRFNRARRSSPQLILFARAFRSRTFHRIDRRRCVRNRLASVGYCSSRCPSSPCMVAAGAHCNGAAFPWLTLPLFSLAAEIGNLWSRLLRG